MNFRYATNLLPVYGTSCGLHRGLEQPGIPLLVAFMDFFLALTFWQKEEDSRLGFDALFRFQDNYNGDLHAARRKSSILYPLHSTSPQTKPVPMLL